MSTVSGQSRGNEPGGSSPLTSINAVRQALGNYFLAMTTGTASILPALASISRSVWVSGSKIKDMPIWGKFTERTLRSFPRIVTVRQAAPFSPSARIGEFVLTDLLLLVERRTAGIPFASTSMEYSPAGSTAWFQWTSYGSVNLPSKLGCALAATVNTQVANTTAANSLS
jgi:hypothetical protein